jgi:hypothetical protein
MRRAPRVLCSARGSEVSKDPGTTGSRYARSARLAAIVWSAAAIIAHSDTGVRFPLWMLLAGAGAVVLVWCVLGALLACLEAQREGAPIMSAIRFSLAGPSYIAATVVLILTATPLKTRLFFAGPALQRSADWFAQLPPGDVERTRPWVGLFQVREFARYGDELRFLTSECGLVDSCGLVFSPSGPPPSRGEDTFAHLYGAWWHWHQSW